MALGKYLIVNDVQMPNPVSGTWTERFNANETIYETEAGTQLSNVKRLNRMSWSAEFNCTGVMKEKLTGYCLEASVTCSISGVEHAGRLRLGGDVSMVEGSEDLNGTDGLWIVPLTFEEF